MAEAVRDRRGRQRRGRWRGLVIFGLLTLLVAGGAAWFFLMGGKMLLAEKPSLAPTLVSLKPFVVTLRDENRDLHFVQLGVDLNVDSAEVAKAVATVLPEVKDALRVEILKHGVADITTPDGIGRLRVALLDSVNGTINTVLRAPPDQPALAAPTLVRSIYFSELVVE